MAEHWVEWSLGVGYVLLGPVAWAVFGWLMVKGRGRLGVLDDAPPLLAASHWPAVTVLVPAKDEGPRVADGLRSILRQDYAGPLGVVGIDDRSADDTGAAMDAVADTDARLTVIHVPPGPLPAGWVGKTHALHAALRSPAAGDDPDGWLVFVDSDVILTRRDALSAVVGACEAKRFDLLSLMPRLECRSFWERLVIPLAGLATGAMYALALTNVEGGAWAKAFANGQFLAIRRRAYDAAGGHAAVRGSFSEDVQLARRVRAGGGRVRIAWGADHAAVRMYAGLGAIFRGWGRNFYAGSMGRPWRILAAAAFVVSCTLSVFPAAAWGVWRHAHPVNALAGWGWLATAGVHAAIVVGVLAVAYRWSGNAARHALLFPLGAAMMLAVFARSLWTCATGRVTWRGTTYPPARDEASRAAGETDRAVGEVRGA